MREFFQKARGTRNFAEEYRQYHQTRERESASVVNNLETKSAFTSRHSREVIGRLSKTAEAVKYDEEVEEAIVGRKPVVKITPRAVHTRNEGYLSKFERSPPKQEYSPKTTRSAKAKLEKNTIVPKQKSSYQPKSKEPMQKSSSSLTKSKNDLFDEVNKDRNSANYGGIEARRRSKPNYLKSQSVKRLSDPTIEALEVFRDAKSPEVKRKRSFQGLCEFCNKMFPTPMMVKHQAGCTKNPNMIKDSQLREEMTSDSKNDTKKQSVVKKSQPASATKKNGISTHLP